MLQDQSKDLNLRFVKSELEELRFRYDDAKHEGRPTEGILQRIQEREQLKTERQKIFAESQAHIEDIRSQIAAKKSAAKTAEDALAKLTTGRDELQQKLENISLGHYPGPTLSPPFIATDWQPKIPKIQQVVLEEFDRNNFNQPVARVDRCTSCHAGINKAGFEDQPNPWKTHPKRELFLGKHDPDKFGCTPCHNGDGPAVNSAQGRARQLLRRRRASCTRCTSARTWRCSAATKMQANCIKCHQSVQHLDGAPTLARGEKLFVELGCHGCHLAEGYEDLAKENGVTADRPVAAAHRRQGRSRVAGALDHEPARVPAAHPHAELHVHAGAGGADRRVPARRPRKQPSARVARRPPRSRRSPAARDAGGAGPGADRHRSAAAPATRSRPTRSPGQLGANKDIAPNLSQIAEKTDARWIYHWIKNPRGYSDVARMPSLRLSDDEARADHGVPGDARARSTPAPDGLDDAARRSRRTSPPARSWCASTAAPAATTSRAWRASRASASSCRPSASKTKEELFFGDRTDLDGDLGRLDVQQAQGRRAPTRPSGSSR